MEFLIRALLLSFALCFAASTAAPCQSSRPDLKSHPEWPKANPKDVASIESTVHAFYSAISTPAGGKLDRNRLLSLFVPSGRIAVGLPASATRPADVIFLSPAEYATSSDRQTVTEGFFDRNPANQIEHFGVMAHVYSTYESRSRADDAQPEARGVKSFELLNSDNRWYILQVYWDSERPDNPLPGKFLHDGPRD